MLQVSLLHFARKNFIMQFSIEIRSGRFIRTGKNGIFRIKKPILGYLLKYLLLQTPL